ncbi:MAG: alpha/beta fold hydrolase [Betaproteobacteria bacterium]
MLAIENLRVPGPAGAIEVDLQDPGPIRRGIALIAHPNPLQGGSKDNKVVTTLARCFSRLGYVALRPNFRGVGETAGLHDQGVGETDDLVAVARYAMKRFETEHLVLAGFSFGSFIQTRVAKQLTHDRLILVGAAVSRFKHETVAPSTLVIHGEVDDVVPLSGVLDWARPQNLPVVVIPGGEHFFHGRLAQLSQIVTDWCR